MYCQVLLTTTMKTSNSTKRTRRIIKELQEEFPGKKIYDLHGDGQHFVCEIEPGNEHPEYDRAIEVMVKTKPHKHLKTKQVYLVRSGTLRLHVQKVIDLKPGDVYIIEPGDIHWAESDDECRVELHSTPAWTKEDHITI